MEKLIPELYREYGLYTNKKKMLPNIKDGLLPVQKRILLASHIISRNKFIKTSKLLGEVMARWHPHSEALGTAEWAVNNGFLDGSGLWGSSVGIEKIGCAAPRYTSIKSNDLIEEIAFKYVRFVEWIPDETEDPEPIYIPTMLPFCLMSKNEYISIGFGFRTEIPCFKISDLINRLFFLLGRKDKIIVKPNIEGCKILSSNEDCEKLLTEGRGEIELQGKYRINESDRSISVFGWCPRTTYQHLLKKIDSYNNYKLLSNGDIGSRDESGPSGTRIDFNITKQRNKDQIFEKMKEAIPESLKSKISYNIITIDNDEIKFSSVDEMLLISYNLYKTAKESFIKNKIIGLENVKKEMDIIKKIRPYISEVVNRNKDITKMYNDLSKLAKVTINSIKEVLEKYKIKRLLSISIDITNINKELKITTKELKMLEKLCLDDYNNIGDHI